MNARTRQQLSSAVAALQRCLDEDAGDDELDDGDDSGDTELDDDDSGDELDEGDDDSESYGEWGRGESIRLSDEQQGVRLSYQGNNVYVGAEPKPADYFDEARGTMNTAAYVAAMLQYHCPPGSSAALRDGTKARAQFNAHIEQAIHDRDRVQQQILDDARARMLANISGQAAAPDGSRSSPLPVYTSAPTPPPSASALRYSEYAERTERYSEPRSAGPAKARTLAEMVQQAIERRDRGREELPGRPA